MSTFEYCSRVGSLDDLLESQHICIWACSSPSHGRAFSLMRRRRNFRFIILWSTRGVTIPPLHKRKSTAFAPLVTATFTTAPSCMRCCAMWKYSKVYLKACPALATWPTQCNGCPMSVRAPCFSKRPTVFGYRAWAATASGVLCSWNKSPFGTCKWLTRSKPTTLQKEI